VNIQIETITTTTGKLDVIRDIEAVRRIIMQVDDMAVLMRRLCRVVARYEANNTVRAQALDYLHRKGLGGSPLRDNKES
jgi:hypothetical protein